MEAPEITITFTGMKHSNTAYTLQCSIFSIFQVSILERQLKEATESSKVSLSEKEHSFLTEKQLLIKELEVEKRNSEKAREVLVYTHAKQLANQESEHNKQLKVCTFVVKICYSF